MTDKKAVRGPKHKTEKRTQKPSEWEEKYKRALADYQNLLKRTALEKEEWGKYANQEAIAAFLPVYDNLKMALAHSDQEAEENNWLKGLQYVLKQFEDILKDLGVEEIKSTGETFDPSCMDALEGQGEKVSQTVKPGYRLKGKILVPAKVILEDKEK